jgi:hypothetical protein
MRVDFDAVIAFKHRLLKQPGRILIRSAPQLRTEFERFCSEELIGWTTMRFSAP